MFRKARQKKGSIVLYVLLLLMFFLVTGLAMVTVQLGSSRDVASLGADAQARYLAQTAIQEARYYIHNIDSSWSGTSVEETVTIGGKVIGTFQYTVTKGGNCYTVQGNGYIPSSSDPQMTTIESLVFHHPNQEIIFEDDFENNNLNAWDSQSGDASSLCEVSTTDPHSGTYHLRCYSTGNNKERYLYTPVLDLSGYCSVEMRFTHRRDGNSDRFRIYQSDDGGSSWTEIYEENSASKSEYIQPTVHLTLEGLTSTMQFAIYSKNDNNEAIYMDDFMIASPYVPHEDNIDFSVVTPVVYTTMWEDDFEDGTLDKWTEDNESGCDWTVETTDPLVGTYHAEMMSTGNNKDCNLITEAIDMSACSTAQIRFSGRRINNTDRVEVHESDDGGSNWDKIADIDGISNSTYAIPANRADIGAFTANTKFKFYCKSDNNEGCRFDEIKIICPSAPYDASVDEVTYTTIWEDDFEDGTLNKWTEDNESGCDWTVETTDPRVGTYHAEMMSTGNNKDCNLISEAIDMSGYSAAQIRFSGRRINNTDRVEVHESDDGGSSWDKIADIDNISKTDYATPANRADIGAFTANTKFKFYCKSDNNEGCRFDEIKIISPDAPYDASVD